eukprot:NODE_10494_length_439_cov_2.923077_g9385_i0.p2 GENE.NODE_10494_length_439_cov_2.923077_g9385_i0~~NODE_10494_length_439_cov_2.923077_g9385_i0.p2  ORF type:complete len:65 (+),score=3.86 NODE_10494_length_439_cov_2.923077_g9385_i0:94-288(+)
MGTPGPSSEGGLGGSWGGGSQLPDFMRSEGGSTRALQDRASWRALGWRVPEPVWGKLQAGSGTR